ncbi:hypothetical protein ACGFNY_39325 [Streptomyces chartreusis]
MALRTPRGLLAIATATVALIVTTGSASATDTAPTLAGPQARLFMVNPVQSSGDQSLTDSKDAAAAVPATA